MRKLKWLFDINILPYVYGIAGREEYLDKMFNRWGEKFYGYYIEHLYIYETKDYKHYNDNK